MLLLQLNPFQLLRTQDEQKWNIWYPGHQNNDSPTHANSETGKGDGYKISDELLELSLFLTKPDGFLDGQRKLMLKAGIIFVWG